MGSLARTWSKLSHDPVHLVALVAFLLDAFLVSASFLPNLSEINAWDEAVYVHSGRTLINGELPALTDSPLVAAFYALTYLPFAGSTFWLVQSTSLGRAILFALVWLGAFSAAKQIVSLAHPLIMVGLLFVSSIPVALLSFPSDSLFVGLAALGLAQFLGYLNTEETKRLSTASFFLGFAALSRNDGLMLGIVLIGLTAILRWRHPGWGRAVLVSAAPFVGIVAGYVLLYGSVTGRLELGTLERTYDNFEAGHQVIFAGEGQLNPVIEAKLEARRVFGTPAENRNSVILAISRNPGVYLQRLLVVLRGLPEQLIAAYGKRAAVPIFLLALRGFWDLLRKRRYRLALILIAWGAPLLSGFLITLFRIGHLQFPFYLVFALGALGLAATARNLASRGERTYWALSLLGFSLYGVIDQKLAITFGALVLLVGLLLAYLMIAVWQQGPKALAIPSLILLAGGLLLHGDYSGPKIRTLGKAPDEQGVLYLEENFAPGTRVAAGSPGPVYSAGMTYMGLTSLDVPRTETPQKFLAWMKGQAIEAVYVDSSLSYANPFYWKQISALVGNGLERVFAAGEGDIQILVLRE